MKTKPDYIVDLSVRGTNGGFVNGEEVGRDSVPCKDRDFLTIGDNYILLLILINPFELGMHLAEGFQAADDVIEDMPSITPPFDSRKTDNLYNPANRAVNGTLSLDGEADVNYGHTQVLE